jgi:hypothetical protein
MHGGQVSLEGQLPKCSGTRVKDIKFVTGVEDITDLNFLAHIAKGNDVSFCHHLASVNFSHFNLLMFVSGLGQNEHSL